MSYTDFMATNRRCVMLEAKTMITEGGRIVIPSFIRKELHLNVGEEVVLKVKSGEIHISTLKQTIKSAQASVRRYNKQKTSLKDALIAERRSEADHEK
jgi:AbrB family looped-hinge helix DNA binding protein